MVGYLDSTIDIDDSVIQFERVLPMLDELHSNLRWYEMKVAEESDL